jgi:hypothetical protein
MLSVEHTKLPSDSDKVSKSAIETFFNIMDVWKFNTSQAMTLLGLKSRSTFFMWKKIRNRQSSHLIAG